MDMLKALAVLHFGNMICISLKISKGAVNLFFGGISQTTFSDLISLVGVGKSPENQLLCKKHLNIGFFVILIKNPTVIFRIVPSAFLS